MAYQYIKPEYQVHRLIASRYPTINLFDWAESPAELEEIAALEGLTNERLLSECGDIHKVAKEDWVGGSGASILMAPFTHCGGPTRFSDGSYGVYYAADSLHTAIAETKFHRERFLIASQERPCKIQMREYTARVQQNLVDITQGDYENLLHPDPALYWQSQDFGREIKTQKEWGLFYPSVRSAGGKCVAIFRPPALTIPIQGSHFSYIWNGDSITTVSREQIII